MTAPEFSHMIDPRHLTARPVNLAATEEERRALARRFALAGVDRLEASIELEADGEAVKANGRISATVVQSCAVSGEEFPVNIDERIALRFVPERPVTAEEIELEESDLDEIAYSGDKFDLGEAVAQSLALAIDPYAEGPNAEQARKDAGLTGEAASSPFAALAVLKKT